MSVLIRGMEMPKDGVYWCEIGVADDIAMITIHGEDRKSFHLVPVPPHGRLADLDKIENEIAQLSPEGYMTGGIRLILDSAPTIIPAEEGE